MNESYTVLVKLSLQNQVSAGLMGLSGQFANTAEKAAALQARLASIRTLALTGFGLSAVGFFGLHIFEKMLKPAEEYAHQLNIMTMAGVKNKDTQKDLANSIADAWKNTNTVITSTATGNLKSLLDMRNVLGDMTEARQTLPLVTKMQAVLESSTEGRALAHGSSFSSDFSFSVAKALDIVGAANTPANFEEQAIKMSQVITAFQGRVNARMYQSVFAYARQAKLPMSETFKYNFLPTMMLEYSMGSFGSGGGSRGVGPMIAAMYRVTNQGYVNKKSLPLIESLGLASRGDSLKTTTTGTTIGHGLKGADLAAENPFLWAQNVLLPAIIKKFGNNLTPTEMGRIITDIFRGNQLAAAAMTEFVLKARNFKRDADIIKNAMPVEQAYQQALMNDPYLARSALSAQWENLQTALTVPLVMILIPALMHLATALNSVALILQKYPMLATTLSYGFVALFGAMALGGIVLLLTAAFQGLAIALSLMAAPLLLLAAPILGIVSAFALIAFGAYELWKTLKEINWEKLGEEFQVLWSSIKKITFMDVVIKFDSFMGSMVKGAINAFKSFFSWLGSAISSLIGLIGGAFGGIISGFKNAVANAHVQGLDGAKGTSNVYQSNMAVGSTIGNFSTKSTATGKPTASNAHSNSTIQVATNINLDGRHLARVVTHHQVKDATSIPNYSQGFDPNMSPTPMVLKGNIA